MEYRIVTNKDGTAAIYKVKSQNGKIHLEAEPEITAEDLRELQRKIVEVNEAFWKSPLTAI